AHGSPGAGGVAPRRLLAWRPAALTCSPCGLPVRPLRIASTTCSGLDLPLLLAAIFSLRCGLESVGRAASRARSRTGDSLSLLSAVVPSVIWPTPSALRLIVNVYAVTPHRVDY